MKKIIYLIMLILLIAFVSATNPTQQYNKIYLNPYYLQSMSANTNYTFTIDVNPPDKISSVKNAIIFFNGQINGQTQTFNLWVNGQICNTQTYSIATAFSTTGNIQFSFDCSNVLTGSGSYNITLRSAVNTGSITGWLDLTYMNNPQGSIDIKGTEYYIGDIATPFLQLKDNQGNPINNGSCYLDVWYPKNSTNQHPYVIQDSPMLQALGDDGIYYYDLTIPSLTGVYMLSAKCSYSYNILWFYPIDEVLYYPTQQIQTGTWLGSSFVLNNPYDSDYQRATISAGNPIISNYSWNMSVYGNLTNVSTINVYFLGQHSTAGTLTIAYWNGTAFINSTNSLTFTGTGSATPVIYADVLLTTTIPSTAIINDVVKLRLTYTGSGVYYVFDNWLALAVLSQAGTIQDVKGSSEMNVHNITDISRDVWNYTTRNLTYYPDLTNYTLINEGVWNYTNRSITYTDNIASAVWQYANRTLSYWDNIVSDIWQYTNRTLTYYQDINYTYATEQIWNYTGRYIQGELI